MMDLLVIATVIGVTLFIREEVRMPAYRIGYLVVVAIIATCMVHEWDEKELSANETAVYEKRIQMELEREMTAFRHDMIVEEATTRAAAYEIECDAGIHAECR